MAIFHSFCRFTGPGKKSTKPVIFQLNPGICFKAEFHSHPNIASQPDTLQKWTKFFAFFFSNVDIPINTLKD